MTTNGESKFSQLLIGLGVAAIGGLMAAILVREETRALLSQRSGTSLKYLKQQADKLGETAGVIVQRGKNLLAGNSPNSVDRSTTAEKQAYQEDRRENLGG